MEEREGEGGEEEMKEALEAIDRVVGDWLEAAREYWRQYTCQRTEE